MIKVKELAKENSKPIWKHFTACKRASKDHSVKEKSTTCFGVKLGYSTSVVDLCVNVMLSIIMSYYI